VRLVTRRTYQEITSLLISGQLDAAWICGFPFVAHRARLALVAVPLWQGKPLYRSYLIAARDRQANGLDDLKGDIHAFSDPDSNSGWLACARPPCRDFTGAGERCRASDRAEGVGGCCPWATGPWP
jgi:phosphonate transport system substrate-binding protein